ncbi:MAG: aminotransferase class V-fold PLP-dependent enzyme [Firmicutes bacterium]|nr:aminotransferase class V-fold PLP-dependent enzyme [Bacillota bacterium]
MNHLWDKMTHYGSSQILPMHMPGHKRKSGFMRGTGLYDITEITGFDDLHHPEGIIKDAMDHAREIYQSDASYFLINGSTCGILSAITAATRPGEKILLARNCHKSALNAVMLRQLTPHWIAPPIVSELGVYGSIDPKEIEKALDEDPHISAVFIVSPTYEGVVSDVETIAKVCHNHKVPLIVDAAHGAHFRFGKMFPKDALSCGADIVIESLHKTLPSLTQTAILHIKSDLISKDQVEFALQAYQSSSPSYLLIASILECLRIMEEKGGEKMENYERNLPLLRAELKNLGGSYLLDKEDGIFDYDMGKIVIGFYGYYGKTLASRLLEKSRIELEMAAPGYIIAMTSLYDTKEDLFRFRTEMKRLRWDMPLRHTGAFPKIMPNIPESAMLPHETMYAETENIPLDEAFGRIAAKTMYLYPPGSPLVAAGEIINEETLRIIRYCNERNYTVHGIDDEKVTVIK